LLVVMQLLATQLITIGDEMEGGKLGAKVMVV
jgi:hypothetical protein